jgi:hypothetical protein
LASGVNVDWGTSFSVPKVSLPHRSRGIMEFHMFAKLASRKLFPTHSSSWLVLFPRPSANSINFCLKAHHFC